MYFFLSKIRNLTAANKDYWHCNPFVFPFVFFLCYVSKLLNTHHILFLNKENNENKVSFISLYLFVRFIYLFIFLTTQRKLPINIRLLHILFFNMKRKNRICKVQSKSNSLYELFFCPLLFSSRGGRMSLSASLGKVFFFSATFVKLHLKENSEYIKLHYFTFSKRCGFSK